jgi:8-oxo-dGTP pyrophosphatase MutT (NUDIX family)
MIDRFVVVPAAYVYFLRPGPRGGQEVLLQLREGTGYMDDHWAAAVAGHVEKGESVFEAAAREAVEEIDVRDIVLAPLCAMHRTQGPAPADPIDERVDYFFTATSWSGEPRIVEPHKCAALGWFSLDELPDPVVPHELSVLEAIRSGDVPPIVAYGFPGTGVRPHGT